MAHTKRPDHAHIVPLHKYFVVFVALLVLMAVTMWAAKQSFPGFLIFSGNFVNNFVALSIATAKASMVVWVFMGVGNGSNLVKMWAYIGFIWFFTMFLIFADYGWRRFEPGITWDTKDGRGGGRETALPRVPVPIDAEEQPAPAEKNIRLR